MYSDSSISIQFKEELSAQQKKILKFLLPALKKEAEKSNSISTYIQVSLDHKTFKSLMSKLKIKDGFGLAEIIFNINSIELLLEKHEDDSNTEFVSTLMLFEDVRVGGGAQNSLDIVLDPLLLFSVCSLVQQK